MSIHSLEAYLAERMEETKGRMQAPNIGDFTRLFEFEERAAQLGAEFFRSFAGVKNREEADSLSRDALQGFLRVSAYSLCASLAQRKSLSGKGIPKNLTTHLGNAFPQQIKAFGATLRAGSSVKLFDRWQKDNCESYEVSTELEGSKVFSFRLSWEWNMPADISDDTEITPLALGDGVIMAIDSEPDEFKPRQVGFTPRDSGYTVEQYISHAAAAYARGYYDGTHPLGEFLTEMMEYYPEAFAEDTASDTATYIATCATDTATDTASRKPRANARKPRANA